jgi:phosphoglycolate phosphatase-like HAD superfamily hydrolase
MEDTPAHKPHPAPVAAALKALGVETAWMVGDTPDDARAARAAGVVSIGVVAPGDQDRESAESQLRAGAARVLAHATEALELANAQT